MTQRSILAGPAPDVVVRASGDVSIEGWDEERVSATSDSRWGLKVEHRSKSEIARLRAGVGERVLFDVHMDMTGHLAKNVRRGIIDVNIGGNGKVYIPRGSNLTVYAGKSADISGIQGSLVAYSGADMRIRRVHTLVHTSAGRAMDLDCDSLAGDVKLTAGRDLRCHIHNLADARFMITDLAGYWEAIVGDGHVKIRLQAGGEVILVTDQEVKGQPPRYILGRIEKPAAT